MIDSIDTTGSRIFARNSLAAERPTVHVATVERSDKLQMQFAQYVQSALSTLSALAPLAAGAQEDRRKTIP